MSEELFKKLSTLDVATIVAIVIVISTAAKIIYPWFIKLKDFIIESNNKRVNNTTLEAIVHETSTKLKALEIRCDQEETREEDIRGELLKAIKETETILINRISNLEKRLTESQEKNNKRVRAELKDKITQSYRKHYNEGTWSKMEKESLEDLIEEYEEAGGSNSFVHTVVQKEMYTWDVTDDNNR